MKRNILGLFEFINILFIFSSVLTAFHSVFRKKTSESFHVCQASIVSRPLENPSPPSGNPVTTLLGWEWGIRTGSVQSFQRNTSVIFKYGGVKGK